MAVGDLITYKGQHFKVLSADHGLRTITLQSWGDMREEVPDDDPDLGKPIKVSQWPFLTAPPVSVRAKRPVRLTRVVRGEPIDLVPFLEWSPTGLLRTGGPIFLSPSLRLRPGELLVLHYDGGVTSRLVVTRAFGSIAQRKKRLEKTPTGPKSIYDYLDGEDDD